MRSSWAVPLLACKPSRPMLKPEWITLAHALADASAEILRAHFGKVISIETKADNSPVSIADKEAERVMRELIAQTCPDHSIFGEEYGAELPSCSADGPREPERPARTRGSGSGGDAPPTRNDYTWVLDPIDGTRAFLEGKKEWGTLIALCKNGVPILGMLNQPITNERWLGISGKPTTHNDLPITANPKHALADAEISTTSAAYFTPVQAGKFVALAKQCKHTVAGGDCYAYGLLARGLRDIVVDAGLKPYDILALVPIIEGAGGTIRTWKNTPVTLENYANIIAASTADLYANARSVLASV